MDLIETVIDHVTQARYDSLGKDMRDVLKTMVVDTMGCATAGSRGHGVAELAGLVRSWGGESEASTIVFGDRVPAFHAAFVNGTAARAWDFDDVHEGGGGHTCASIVPTAFVLAQYARKKVSGRELMLAIAIGTDLAARMRQALHDRNTWVTETFVPFGIVGMASQLLGLTRKETQAAMGIAYAQSSHNGQGTIDGALTVRLQQGLSAKSGVLALQLAKIGFFGPKDILQGSLGLYPLYARNEFNPEAITGDLGRRYELINTSIKPYPTCKFTHIPIATTCEMLARHAIKPSEVKHITIRTNQVAYTKCAVSPQKRRPGSVVDVQFSIMVAVAIGVLRGNVTLAELKKENWEDPEILAFADKINVVVDPELEALPVIVAPNIIEIETVSGRKHSQRTERVIGSPDNRMSEEQVDAKFRGCVQFAALPVAKKKPRSSCVWRETWRTSMTCVPWSISWCQGSKRTGFRRRGAP